jgi:predicted dehydrogenase
MLPDIVGRRQFLRQALAAGTATLAAGSWGLRPQPALARPARSPNERLNIAIVGVANKGKHNLDNVASENIVALCDVDGNFLAQIGEQYPNAARYADYRTLFDERTDLDAVVVSTPDHSHALPTILALQRGLDVYCEKPLAHSVWEVRQMRQWAARNQCVTQMGTQIHAGDNYRRAVEIVQAGILGRIERVHVWHGNAVKPGVRVKEATPPAGVEYDLWIGPAPYRPYHESHFHFNWRYWFDFGGGILADMGCHYIDLPFWALDLRYPTSAEAHGEKTYDGENDVPDRLQADWHFPARSTATGEELPPVHLTWYQCGLMPPGAEEYGLGSAVLFEGERGRLLADYGTHKLFLEPGLEADTPPQTIPASIGHWAEWIEACKSRGPTTCNFDYSGALAECVLLGNVSYRGGQTKLTWDAEKFEIADCPDAVPFLRTEYRESWTLPTA